MAGASKGHLHAGHKAATTRCARQITPTPLLEGNHPRAKQGSGPTSFRSRDVPEPVQTFTKWQNQFLNLQRTFPRTRAAKGLGYGVPLAGPGAEGRQSLETDHEDSQPHVEAGLDVGQRDFNQPLGEEIRNGAVRASCPLPEGKAGWAVEWVPWMGLPYSAEQGRTAVWGPWVCLAWHMDARLSGIEWQNPTRTRHGWQWHVKDGISKWIESWKTRDFKGVKNDDLWRVLNDINSPMIEWKWVKAHAGNPENEKADKLAHDQALKQKEILKG